MAYKSPSHFEKLLKKAKAGQEKQAHGKLEALKKNPKPINMNRNKNFVKWH